MKFDIFHSVKHMSDRKRTHYFTIKILLIVGIVSLVLSAVLLFNIAKEYKKGAMQPTESKELLNLSRKFRKKPTDNEIIKSFENLNSKLSDNHIRFLKTRDKLIPIILFLMVLGILLTKKSQLLQYHPEDHILPPADKDVSHLSWLIPVISGFLMPIVVIVLTYLLPAGGK